MKKKIIKMVGTICYEAIVLLALFFALGFIGLIADGDLFSVINHADMKDFVILMLMFISVKVTIYDIVIKTKKIRNWFKEIKG